MPLVLIATATVLVAASGLPGLCLSRLSRSGEKIAAWMSGIAMLVGLTGAWLGLHQVDTVESVFPWPALGDSIIGVDALSAFFLFPVFLMGGLGSIYGLGYWPQSHHPGNGRKLRLFWGLLVAGLVIVVISRHAMAFLLGWEVMAMSAFFLVSTEDCRAECRKAGWLYLVAAHVGTLTLFALFAMWRWATGSYSLQPAAVDAIDLGVLNVLFFLALISFGLKAGVMPLHFWLPSAHANAPSHVSAMLSGVVLKMGIYGLLRFLSLLPAPPAAWGGLILALGAVSGLLGVVFAIGQHDLKRLLAYHSVENIGIILMGLGLAMLGRSEGRSEWIVLGLAGCLLHTWNHAIFKSLLFLCAGAVVHTAHTRKIDRLGGLAKAMPWTAAMFLVGAVAICGLPPLNGFVSELLVYLGLLDSVLSHGEGGAAVVLVAPVLAMIGALAVACFVKVYGSVFLGNPRTHAAMNIHEAPMTMRGPMVVLAACCALIGLAPILVTPILENAIAVCTPQTRLVHQPVSLNALAPLKAVGVMSVSLVALIALLAATMAWRATATRRAGTWDCGYARPTPRMQYSASSFVQMIVVLFGWVLRARVHGPTIQGAFPSDSPATSMDSHVEDAVLDRILLPASQGIERWLGWFRRFQQGLAQHYVLYILIVVIAMLIPLISFDEFYARLFAR